MFIKSVAGEFPIEISKFEVECDALVIVGKMGVWDARTYVDPGDLVRILAKLFLSPAIFIYVLKAPFLAVRGKKPGRSSPTDNHQG